MSNSNENKANHQKLTDPFEPANLRLSQDFASTIGVKKLITNVPCRKPNRQEFVRVRIGEEWRLDTMVFEDTVDRETYLVVPQLACEIAEEVRPVCLRYAITRQNNIFLWPCKLPGIDGRTNPWNESALQAAQHAEKHWVRIVANMAAGMYDVFEASADIPDPAWPDEDIPNLTRLLELAFKEKYIQSADHPMLKRLRGES